MQSLEELEELGANISIRHYAGVLAGFAKDDAQARRDLKSVSLLLKSLIDEARERALAADFAQARRCPRG